MTVWRHRLALVALLGLGVAGCSKSEPEPPEMNMTVQELEPTPEPTPTEEPTPVAIPTPTPTPGNDTAILPPPEDTAPDAQMMDDASATGMTARSDRSGRGDDFDTAPVETRRRD